MLPFLHLGPISIPTYGLMVALGLLTAAYVMEADFRRRKLDADVFFIIGVTGLVGLIGSRVYDVLQTLQAFFANPWPMLFSRYGFTWFGALLAGVPVLVVMARRVRIPMLEFLDAASPAAAVGYALGRMGCQLSGDGDYGIPTTLPWGMSYPNGTVPTLERVHPTPVYEFILWMAIAAFLWQVGNRALRGTRVAGGIFCGYLILTGVARFFIEFIRINPRTIYGLTNAQVVSLGCVAVGAALLLRLKGRQPKEEAGR